MLYLDRATLIHSMYFYSLFDQDDDGFILYESKAISYYIASKYPDRGTPLLPTGLKANALYQQAVFAQVSHFDDHAMKALREVLGKRQVLFIPINQAVILTILYVYVYWFVSPPGVEA